MADLLLNKRTSVDGEEVIVRAVQFFSTASWRVSSQSARAATFEGKLPIPWFMLLCTFLGFALCIVPGVILYVMVIRKMNRFQNLVVTVSSAGSSTEVVVTHPSQAKKLAKRFLESLPPVS